MKNFIYRMIHALLIVAIVLLSGCGTFRKVFKLKESSKSEKTYHVAMDSTTKHTDRSIITIRETVDTTVTTPERKVTQARPMNLDSLVNGIMAIKSDIVDVRLLLNPTTGVLTADATVKPQSLPIHLDRLTTKQNDITDQSNLSRQQDSTSKQQSSRNEVQKEPAKMGVWLIAVIIGLVVIIGGIALWRKINRK